MGILNIFKGKAKAEEPVAKPVEKKEKKIEAKTTAKPIKYEKNKDKQPRKWVDDLSTKPKVEEFKLEVKQGLTFERPEVKEQTFKTHTPTGFDQGAIVEGIIIAEQGDDFLVDIEYQSDAILPKTEAADYQIGDEVQAVIFRKNFDEIYISANRFAKQNSVNELIAKMDAKEIIEGKVLSYDKFFFNVEIAPNVIGKCHVRNIDSAFVDQPNPFLNNTYKFVIVKYSQKNGFEISRRELIDQETQVTFDKIEVGQVIDATIKKCLDKVIIMTYEGLDVIVPIKEVNYSFITNCQQGLDELNLKEGDTIKVEVLEKRVDQVKRDTTKNVVVTSIRKTLEDPFTLFVKTHQVDSEINGVVSKVEHTFSLVTLANNVQGLLHNNDLHEQRKLIVGQEINVQISEIDDEKRKIKLIEVNKSA